MLTIERKSKFYKNGRSNFYGGFKRMLSANPEDSHIIVDQKDIVRSWNVHSRFRKTYNGANIDDIAKDHAMDNRILPISYRAYTSEKIHTLYLEHKEEWPNIQEIQHSDYILGLLDGIEKQ